MLTPEQIAEDRKEMNISYWKYVKTGKYKDALDTIDRLRAEVAALREAGEGLAEVINDAWPGLEGRSYERPITEIHAETVAALARWREVTSSGAGRQWGESQPSPPPDAEARAE